MKQLNHIVVAVPEREVLDPIMEKAIRLASASGARISLVQTCWDPVSDPATHFPQEDVESIAARLKRAELNHLSAAAARYREAAADLRTHVIWSRRHAPAVAAFARDTAADLILIPCHASSALGRLRLPDAVKLVGHTELPLLACSTSRWGKAVDLLVLVDAADPAHDSLNRRLMAAAGLFSTLLSGSMHLATVFEMPGGGLGTEEDQARYRQAVTQRLQTRLQTLAAFSAQPPTDIHVLQGALPQRADQLAASFEAEILVVGTAARRGLDRLFLGNSAEALLLEQTDRDLLLVPEP